MMRIVERVKFVEMKEGKEWINSMMFVHDETL
jgi:hypothetical protein